VLRQQAALRRAVPLARAWQAPVRRARQRQVAPGQLEAGELAQLEVQPARRPRHLLGHRYGQLRY